MNRGRYHVVAGLAHVDMIVGMHQFARPNWLACELGAPIRDDFISVGVCACTRTGLENVQRKMIIEFSFNNFFSRSDDQRRTLRIKQAEIAICLRGSRFDQAKSANKRARKTVTAYRKI